MTAPAPQKTTEPRMIVIARELGTFAYGIKTTEINISHAKEDLEGRKIYLAPVEGWPGKNEGERKLAAEKAYAADETCQKLAATIRKSENDLAELQANQQALLDERRALEWLIRARMVDAMQENHIDQNGSAAPVEESAFDDVGQKQLDDGLMEFYREEQAWNETGQPPAPTTTDDGIPF